MGYRSLEAQWQDKSVNLIKDLTIDMVRVWVINTLWSSKNDGELGEGCKMGSTGGEEAGREVGRGRVCGVGPGGGAFWGRALEESLALRIILIFF